MQQQSHSVSLPGELSPIHLAGAPPPATGRSVTVSAHSAQLPLPRPGIFSPGRCVDLPSAFAQPAAYGDLIAISRILRKC